MSIIKKSLANYNKENIILVGSDYKKVAQKLLSDSELSYANTQLTKEEKKLISINQSGRLIFIVIPSAKLSTFAQNEEMRKHGNTICGILNEAKAISVVVAGNEKNKKIELALAEGIVLANYQFIHHKTKAEKEKHSLKLVVLDNKNILPKEIDHLNILIEATIKARDLVNEPVNVLNAEALAKVFVKLSKEAGFSAEVLNKSKIEQLKMGGLLCVNQGSIDPPTFTIMEYKPKGAKNKKPYVLVGKGVVYDTGGLSLKPTANSMDLMKCDMAGGAAVGCTMYAIAKAKLPVHVIGLVPATDNRPGGNAFAPGDIITMYDGSSIEMLNSDAEGRMILADALTYAKKYDPALVIDLATLTGAAAAAIGHYGIVCMGTAGENIKNRLKTSGENVYERLVEFPFWDEYKDLLKSDIADMKNIGGGVGGSITAGKFLEHFTDYPYMHFDIAGPAFTTARDSYRGKGGTGVGVRLLFDFFKNL